MNKIEKEKKVHDDKLKTFFEKEKRRKRRRRREFIQTNEKS